MQPPEITPDLNPNPTFVDSITEHIGTAYGLGLIAVLAHKMQVDVDMITWPDFPREVMNSMSHPFLGYIGAAIANVIFRTKSYAKRVYYGSGLGTLANFGTEIAQAWWLPHTPETNFLATRNMPETMKDYVFALGGIGIFAIREKRIRKKEYKNSTYSLD